MIMGQVIYLKVIKVQTSWKATTENKLHCKTISNKLENEGEI